MTSSFIKKLQANRFSSTKPMDKLLSSWSSSVKSLPESYVFPVDSRPGDTSVPLCNTFPVIDLEAALANDRHDAIQQILKACQDFGFFQVCQNYILIQSNLLYILLHAFVKRENGEGLVLVDAFWLRCTRPNQYSCGRFQTFLQLMFFQQSLNTCLFEEMTLGTLYYQATMPLCRIT